MLDFIHQLRPSDAIHILKQLTQFKSSLPLEMHFNLLMEAAELHKRRGNHLVALSLCESASELIPNHSNVTRLLLECHRDLNNWTELRHVAEDTLALGNIPHSKSSHLIMDAHCALGHYWLQMNNADLARESYLAAMRVHPYCLEAINALRKHYLLAKNDLANLVSSQQGQNHPDVSSVPQWFHQHCLSRIDLSLVTDWTHLPLRRQWLFEAQKRWRTGQYREALTLLDTNRPINQWCDVSTDECCFKLSLLYHLSDIPGLCLFLSELQSSSSVTSVSSSLLSYAMGVYYLAKQQMDKASTYFSLAITSTKGLSPAWMAQAMALERMDEHDAAMAVYRQTTLLFPMLSPCTLALASYLTQRGLSCDARSLLVQFPDEWMAHNDLAVLALRDKMPRMALRHQRRSLTLFLRASTTFLKHSQTSQPLRLSASLLYSHHRELFLLVWNLALIYFRLCCFHSALALFETCRPFLYNAMEEGISTSAVHVACGASRLVLHRSSEAQDDFQRALSNRPDPLAEKLLKIAQELTRRRIQQELSLKKQTERRPQPFFYLENGPLPHGDE